MLANIQLASPYWLVLLVAPVILGRLTLTSRWLRSDESYRLRHPAAAMLADIQEKLFTRKRKRSVIWRWAVFALMVLALAQPQQLGKKLPASPQQRDIVFVIDTSVSMLLKDYLVNGKRIDRMTMLRGVLGRFARSLKGSRLSLIVFGDNAYTLLPLTRDRQLVLSMLDKVETGMAGRSKALGDALSLAVRQAKSSTRKRRLLILFSDASRATGTITPEEAAELAASENLRIYTIAIGASKKSAAEKHFAGLIYDVASLERLKTIAAKTGGSFFQASDTESLQQAIRTIETSERNPARKTEQYAVTPLYSWPLLAAVILLLSVRTASILRGGH
jgi:Ca-activated chloride channel family protein